MPFRITVDGKSWMDEDLSIDEAVAIEDETGESWLVINPLRSAKHAKAMMVRFLMRDMTEDEARAKVGRLSLKAALDGIVHVDDDRPAEFDNGMPVVDPKEEPAEPVTT